MSPSSFDLPLLCRLSQSVVEPPVHDFGQSGRGSEVPRISRFSFPNPFVSSFSLTLSSLCEFSLVATPTRCPQDALLLPHRPRHLHHTSIPLQKPAIMVNLNRRQFLKVLRRNLRAYSRVNHREVVEALSHRNLS